MMLFGQTLDIWDANNTKNQFRHGFKWIQILQQQLILSFWLHFYNFCLDVWHSLYFTSVISLSSANPITAVVLMVVMLIKCFLTKILTFSGYSLHSPVHIHGVTNISLSLFCPYTPQFPWEVTLSDPTEEDDQEPRDEDKQCNHVMPHLQFTARYIWIIYCDIPGRRWWWHGNIQRITNILASVK